MKYKIKDESGDKNYFTIVPNYILNHSTPYDRDVYIQMKRIAGENGTCWMSLNNLAKQCGISESRLKKSIKYLLEHKWIKRIGERGVETSGGIQKTIEYKIVDIWDINNDFYKKGGRQKPTLRGGVRKGGLSETSKGGRQKPTKNNPINKNQEDFFEKKSFCENYYEKETKQTYKSKHKIAEKKGIKLKVTPRTKNQEKTFEALKMVEYFKDKAQEIHGMQFFKVQDESRNKAVRKLIIRASKECDLKSLIEWWIDGAGEWAGYEPENCFSTKMIERFLNKDKTNSTINYDK